VRLDDSSVPERLTKWQWVDLFPSNSTSRVKLVHALIQRASSLDAVALPVLEEVTDTHHTLDIKYFYYISPPKLEMLATQLGLTFSGSAVKDVVRDVHKITTALQASGLIEELQPDRKVETGRFYISTETWRHGLFYFKAGYSSKKPLVTGVMYALWTTHAGSVLLLVGSPNHILGEKVVQQGVFIPGTSGAVDKVFQIAGRLSVDEPALVTGKDMGRWRYSDVPGYEIRASDKVGDRDEDEIRQRLPLPYSWDSGRNALSLAILCFRHLGQLSSTRVEVLFRLFAKESAAGLSLQDDFDACRNKWLNYDFIREKPEHLAEEKAIWERIAMEVGRFQLKQYKDIYIGSPVYTALL
jgi:hypothetical protein